MAGEEDEDYVNRTWRDYLTAQLSMASQSEEPRPRRASARVYERNPPTPNPNTSSRRPSTYIIDTQGRHRDSDRIRERRPTLSAGENSRSVAARIYEEFRSSRVAALRIAPGNILEWPAPPETQRQSRDHFGSRDRDRGRDRPPPTPAAPEQETPSPSVGFRRRQLEALRASRREYDSQASGLRTRAQLPHRPGEPRFEDIWRESVEESVEELRTAQRRQRRREQRESRNQVANPPADNWEAFEEQRREIERRRSARRRMMPTPTLSSTPEVDTPPEPVTAPAPSRPTRPTTPGGTGLELRSKYLGEFTLGLVKKSDPTITLDQAIMDAEREVRETCSAGRRTGTTSSRAALNPTENPTEDRNHLLTERMVLLGISDGSTAVMERTRPRNLRTPTNTRSAPPAQPDSPSTNGETGGNGETRRIPIRSESTRQTSAERIRVLTQNLQRLQAVIDECESNASYLQDVQRLLTDTKEMIERERGHGPNPTTVQPPVANPEARDYCLSIWEAGSTSDALDAAGSSNLPTLEAFVTELPSTARPEAQTETEETEEGEGEGEEEEETEEAEFVEETSASSQESSTTDEDEEYNAWDAHSTMRNFTESTFNVDSDWEYNNGRLTRSRNRNRINIENDPRIRVNDPEADREAARARLRNLSPATREFHRSIGIRDSDDEDERANIIMMPNPREYTGETDDETPLPLFPDLMAGGDCPEVGSEASESRDEEEQVDEEDEEEVEDEEEIVDEEDVNAEGESEWEDADEVESDDENDDIVNQVPPPPELFSGPGPSLTPFHGTPPPRVELDETDVEIDELLDSVKRKDDKDYLARLQVVKQAAGAKAMTLEVRRQKAIKLEAAATFVATSLEARMKKTLEDEAASLNARLQEAAQIETAASDARFQAANDLIAAAVSAATTTTEEGETICCEENSKIVTDDTLSQEKMSADPDEVSLKEVQDEIPVIEAEHLEKPDIGEEPSVMEAEISDDGQTTVCKEEKPEASAVPVSIEPVKKESGLKVFYHKLSTSIANMTKKGNSSAAAAEKKSPPKKCEVKDQKEVKKCDQSDKKGQNDVVEEADQCKIPGPAPHHRNKILTSNETTPKIKLN